MHFDDDHTYDNLPEEGDELLLETGDGGVVELGEATIDVDGDGVADSRVVIEDGDAYLVSDIDGDGYVDQIQENPGNTPGQGDNRTGRDGSDRGDRGDRTGGDEPVTVGRDTSDLVPVAPGSALDEVERPEEREDPYRPDQVSNPVGEPGPMVVEHEGEWLEIGEPTVDSDRDGSPDTVVTTLDDGSAIGFTDVDGDGDADRITSISADGVVEVAEPDGRGGWTTVARGYVTPDGEVVMEDR